MKLLITGAAHFNDEQLNMISSLGFDIVFQADEKGEPVTDFSTIDAVVCNGLFLYHDFDEFKNLKFIQLTSAGLDRVPVKRIKEKGTDLFNARGVYSIPMAEYALSGVLGLYKNLSFFNSNQKKHIWEKDRNIVELNGKTVTIIGCGSVGTECAKRFKAFETNVIGVDIFNNGNPYFDEFYLLSDIGIALNKADIVVLTLPLTDETKGMFNEELFSEFKNNSILVNIARGSIVNECDLINALEKGKLGGAVLDVVEEEPLPENSPLWDMKNVIITPHNSFVSPNNTKRLFELAYNNLKCFTEGK